MYRSTTLISGLAVALATASPLAAQVATEGMTEEMQRPPDQMTCADISMMDSATVPGTLYFISGYSEGRDAQTVTGPEGTPTGEAEATAEALDVQTPEFGRITGYFEIPVERIMQVCAESPDRSVSDVVREERDMTGGDAGSATGDGSGSTDASGAGSDSGTD